MGSLPAETGGVNNLPDGEPRRRKLPGIRFVQTDYRQGDARPVARLPEFCPYLEEDDQDPACRVLVHHLRNRKTGSVRQIVVCWCAGHRKAFGLYPPDGVPYARLPWSPVGLAGEVLRVVEEALPPSSDQRQVKLSPRLTSFVPTYPGAAVDEGRNVFWPKQGFSWAAEPSLHTHPRQETQVRRSLRTLRVLGIDGAGVDGRDRLAISEVLDLPLAVLLDLEASVPEVVGGETPSVRGRVVSAALEALPEVSPRCLAHRLAMAGHLAGVWGRPWVFEVATGRFWSEPFRRHGTEAQAV